MSKSPRGGLGRGIESLIRTSAHAPVAPAPVPDAVPAPSAAAAPDPVAASNPVVAPNPPDEPSSRDSVHLIEAQSDQGQHAPAVPTPASESNHAEPQAQTSSAPGVNGLAGKTNGSSGLSPLDVFWGPHTDQDLATRGGAGSPDREQRSADGRPEFRDLPVGDVHANARQPRSVFDEEALAELAHSIQAFGVLQPIVVRPDPSAPGTYELVMGERRLRAARAAHLETIPAVVRHTADDAMLRDALLENLHRAQLNPLEEAAAYQQLLEEFGVTHDELATRIGRSRSQVSNTVRLMNLSLPVQRRVAAGVLSAGHARALLALTDSETQDDLAARIVAEGLSVRATEELVSLTAKGLIGATRRRPTRHFVAPAATDLAERLSDRFDTTVRVDIGRRKGKVTIEFATVDDLERIVEVMAPGLASVRTTGLTATTAAADSGGSDVD
jgi:ParB family transcriptional regulator, chromosome partitioning protein